MFAAFIAAVSAIIVACIIGNQRESMIPPKKTALKAKPAKTIAPVAKAEPEVVAPKNSSALNAILFIGCFLVIAAMMGFVASFDESLVPPIVIAVTLVTIVISLLLRASVPFLRSSSLAFNITALLMFIFWFPSLDALRIDGFAIPFVVFLFATLSAVASAAVFRIRGFWYVPFALSICLVFSLFTFLANLTDVDVIALYGFPINFLILAIICRYLWRSHASFLPIPVRSAVLVFSYIYLGFGLVSALGGLVDGDVSFATSITLLLTAVVFFIDYSLAKKSLAALRIVLQILLTAICFDILRLAEAEYEMSLTILSLSAIFGALIQAGISLGIMLKRPTEEAHQIERYTLSFAIAALSIVAGLSGLIAFGGDLSSGYTTFFLISEIISLIIGMGLCFGTVIVDRNAPMIIPGFLLLATAVTNEQIVDIIDNNMLIGIFLGIISLFAAFSYFIIEKYDEKNAIAASITASIIPAVISFFYCVAEDSGYWIPVMIISAILFVFGAKTKKLLITDFGFYVGAAAFALLIGDITTSNNIDLGEFEAPLTLVAWLAIPITVILRDFAHELKSGVIKSATGEFIAGSLLFLITSDSLSVAYLSQKSNPGSLFSLIVIFILRILLIIYSIRKKCTPMVIIATLALFATVVNTIGLDLWFCILIAGLCLIGYVIYAAYKAYTKANLEKAAPTAPAVPQNTEPQKNTDVQVEKTEDIDKKTVA